MTPLTHIIEPLALLMVWQGGDESDSTSRTRRIVGKVSRGQDASAKLVYLVNTEDYALARKHGFSGYPGFSLNASEHTSETVMEALMRRLPPRKREDFADYLALHHLPNPFNYSDFALLGYTEARLPSDGFSIIPVFDPNETPCEYIIEVAGARYHRAHVDSLNIGDSVDLRVELDNIAESGAIAIFHNNNKIGYVNRALIPTITAWMRSKNINAVIERYNGNINRPVIHVHLLIT